jgi:p-hydroxybenzoate 3-monooxygenase
MHQEGLVHGGIELMWDGRRHRVDLNRYSGGQNVMVYGQTEVTHDLMQARAVAGLPTVYEARNTAVHDFGTTAPTSPGTRTASRTAWTATSSPAATASTACAAPARRARPSPNTRRSTLRLAGPAGRHPAGQRRADLHQQPARLCPVQPAQQTRSRYYLQVPLTNHVEDWSDDAFWQELKLRLDDEGRDKLVTGPSLEKSIAPLRSFVTEPLRFGRMFLAGDAGHIVPPTGAKGLNLATTDVKYLSNALVEFYRDRARPASTTIRASAWAASGAPSASRGGSRS